MSPIEAPASPPLLYAMRDHLTKSPQIPGFPQFLPPPPGMPFMPPPLHPFIPPPPPNLGDHRPPPLGRMSSPPINSRYSPSSVSYSHYDRSSSPSDSEYGASPPQRRGYSPFNNRGDDRRRPPVRSNGRNMNKGMFLFDFLLFFFLIFFLLIGTASSGSANSNESLEKINRHKV